MDILKTMWSNFGSEVMKVLPLSPFRDWISYLAAVPYLGYIKWFIPLATIAKITAAWVGAIATYYIYSTILRWLNMVE